ncbi:MAG TPA: L-threonylcarbamoyladenylate synthase [Tepidisphaeraceae bacterium]|nr:L-threonylcarbamoyladenylate synthase [Tepidisphaeraceae bacterium]
MNSEPGDAKALIARAVEILRRGGLVAFPTETVYGLGADASNAAAVRRIFAAKGRPSTNPLIVHVSNAQTARRYARDWPMIAQTLADRFWPGPLTLVVPKSNAIVAEATAELTSVGLRAPDHPLALRLLREFDGAIAAPSANRSNRVSPTTAAHVRRELGDAVDLIIDGGPCQVGIESTVLDLTSEHPVILRPGGISRAQIEEVIGPIECANVTVGHHQPATSPGQQPIHYAPIAPAWRFTPDQPEKVERWCREHPAAPAVILAIEGIPIREGEAPAEPNHPVEDTRCKLKSLHHKPSGSAGASPSAMASGSPHRVVVMPGDSAEYSRRFYGELHEADQSGAAVIFIEIPPDQPEWSAVRDRIMRATRAL